MKEVLGERGPKNLNEVSKLNSESQDLYFVSKRRLALKYWIKHQFAHFMVYKSIDHSKLPSILFFTITQKKYSGTSPYGHLYNTDISLLRTVHLVPERPKSI